MVLAAKVFIPSKDRIKGRGDADKEASPTEMEYDAISADPDSEAAAIRKIVGENLDMTSTPEMMRYMILEMARLKEHVSGIEGAVSDGQQKAMNKLANNYASPRATPTDKGTTDTPAPDGSESRGDCVQREMSLSRRRVKKHVSAKKLANGGEVVTQPKPMSTVDRDVTAAIAASSHLADVATPSVAPTVAAAAEAPSNASNPREKAALGEHSLI